MSREYPAKRSAGEDRVQ